MQDLALFTLEASRPLAERVADVLTTRVQPHEERAFEDGEHKSRPLVNVRGADVFVLHSLYADAEQSVNDKLVRLLLFAGALRDADARSVTVVAPYLCYARKDRKTKPRDPVSTRYVASLFEAVGVDRVVTVDVHNLAAFQNAARNRTEHLEARPLLVEHFARRLGREPVAVVSPDAGGTKRAERFRAALEQELGRAVASGMMEKQRSEGVVSGEAFVGDVDGRTVILVDDLVSSGTTLLRAARACRARGARNVHAAATHGLFVGADRLFADPALDTVVVTDTVPPFRVRTREKLVVLDVAPLLADAISRLHAGGSITELA